MLNHRTTHSIGFVGLRLFISFDCLATILDSQNVELGRVKEGKEGGGVGVLPDSLSLLPLHSSFAFAPSLQCFPNPRWRLINTPWNIQCSLAQNTPVLQARQHSMSNLNNGFQGSTNSIGGSHVEVYFLNRFGACASGLSTLSVKKTHSQCTSWYFSNHIL